MDDAPLAYRASVLREVQRLLSLQDREMFSHTYGCFDRTYWGWKFTDFPGARFQEAAYALANLFAHPFPGNHLSGRPQMLEWTRASMMFWRRIQYGDGSFDEAYPYERSLAATAFTGFYVGEAYRIVEQALSADERAELKGAFVRAGDWLCRNDERHGVLSNHLAAAAAALILIAQICEETRYAKRSRHFVQRILDRQSPEGWYEEYGGADAGYQTHATFYLARLWQMTGNVDLLESLRRSIRFLQFLIHPNRTLGGEYGSRNTEFYFPAGLEILAAAVPEAGLMARFMRPAVCAGTAVGLAAMDPYNFLPMLNNYLFAAEHASDLRQLSGKLPCEAEGEWYFPDAGLFVKSTNSYYAILGLSKGGVLRVYDRSTGDPWAMDCGYWAETAAGRVVSSQSLNRKGNWRRQLDGFTAETEFVEVIRRTQRPWLFVAFRMFSITLGRLPWVSYWLKGLLVSVLIHRRRPAQMRLTRTVRFDADRVRVQDRVEGSDRLRLRRIKRGTKFATIHMGSARYFQEQELIPVAPTGQSDLTQEVALEGCATFDWVIRPVERGVGDR